jgi:hypothetical protein
MSERSFPRVAILTLSATLAFVGCGADDVIVESPTASVPTVQSVAPCLDQVVPGTGKTLVELIVPDTITVDLSQASGFPNGRALPDPVIDITLAAALLDMRVHPVDTFVRMPLNPAVNDRPFRTEFPFLALPQGNPPLSGSDTATSFNFIDAPDSAYVRVDRTGMPAISPALIGVPVRNAYNDAGPGEDDAFVFAGELTTQLTTLAQVLLDDFAAAGLTPCAAVQ